MLTHTRTGVGASELPLPAALVRKGLLGRPRIRSVSVTVGLWPRCHATGISRTLDVAVASASFVGQGTR